MWYMRCKQQCTLPTVPADRDATGGRREEERTICIHESHNSSAEAAHGLLWESLSTHTNLCQPAAAGTAQSFRALVSIES